VLVVPTAWFPNGTEAGAREAEGATPVPDKETVWDAAGFATVIVTFPDLVPVALGVNVTLIAQVPLMARVAGKAGAVALPHLFVSEKLAGFCPPIEMLLICSGAVPVLDKVTA
jgi:hypothetical protein